MFADQSACIALWWIGAGLLVSGSVIIGRREDGEVDASAGDVGAGSDGKVKQSQSGSDGSRTSGRSDTSNTAASRRSPRLKSG